MNIGQTLQTAQQLHQQGKLQQAFDLYQKIIQIKPKHAEAIHLIGVVLAQTQQPQHAIAYFQQAIKLKPKVAVYYNHLGNALQTIGQLSTARHAYHQALQLAPNDADIYSNLAGVYVKSEKLEEAENCYQQAIKLNSHHVDAYHNLVIVLVKLEKYQIAYDFCQKALKLKLSPAKTYADLARIEIEQEHWQQAQDYLQQALNLQPSYAEAYHLLGVVASEQQLDEQAKQHYETAIKHDPNYAEAYVNLANIYANEQKLDIAQHFYQKAIQAKPYLPDTYANLAKIKQRLNEVIPARKYCEQALQLRPDSYELHQSYSQVLLAAGEFELGWKSFAYRPSRVPSSSDFKAVGGQFEIEPLAQDLTGKHIFIRKDQGLGDELLFLRFAPLLKQRGAVLTYQCGKKIKTMLQRLDWIDTVLDPDQPVPDAVDAKYLVGDLPLALHIKRVEEIPDAVQLSVLPDKLLAIKAKLPQDGKPLIGLTWRAGQPTSEVSKKFKDKVLQKEMPLDLLLDILHGIDAHFIILQRYPVADELAKIKQVLTQKSYDFTDLSDDLESMLALLSLLDDYIAVSNTNLHLSIGLNKAARVLIPNPPDWRWMRAGDHSAWFKSFKIYRQTAHDDWDGCFQQLRDDLHDVFG